MVVRVCVTVVLPANRAGAAYTSRIAFGYVVAFVCFTVISLACRAIRSPAGRFTIVSMLVTNEGYRKGQLNVGRALVNSDNVGFARNQISGKSELKTVTAVIVLGKKFHIGIVQENVRVFYAVFRSKGIFARYLGDKLNVSFLRIFC